MSKIADRALKGIFFTMLLFVLFFASGCAGECDACHQYERLRTYNTASGREYHYCDDCYSMAKMFQR